MRTSPLPAVVAAVSAVLLDVLLAAGLHDPLRVVLALWFVLAGPGLSYVPLVDGLAPEAAVAVGLGLGLALTAIAATLLGLVGALTLGAGFGTLQALCVAGWVLQARRWTRGQPA